MGLSKWVLWWFEGIVEHAGPWGALPLSPSFSYASSLHNGAKPLCKLGLTNPRALLLQGDEVGGRAQCHRGVSLRWDLHPVACREQTTAEWTGRRWLCAIIAAGDKLQTLMRAGPGSVLHCSAQQGGSEGQHRQRMFLQRFWPFAQRSRGGAKWLQPGFWPLFCGQRQQRGFLHKRLQESLKKWHKVFRT